jgi:hypothetical protein
VQRLKSFSTLLYIFGLTKDCVFDNMICIYAALPLLHFHPIVKRLQTHKWQNKDLSLLVKLKTLYLAAMLAYPQIFVPQ